MHFFLFRNDHTIVVSNVELIKDC